MVGGGMVSQFIIGGNAMIKRSAKALAVAVSASMLLGSFQAHAGGLTGSLNKMYLVTATNPQAINTLKSYGFYGGQLTIGAINSGVNVVRFAPPKISMGCGRVDMFFGAFSFISGEQLQQLVRGIIAAAPAFVMEAAISQMCDKCATIMDKLRTLANRVNSLARNSCEIAGALFSPPDKSSGYRKSIADRFNDVSVAFNDVIDTLSATVRSDTKSTPEMGDKIESTNGGKGKSEGSLPKGDLICKVLAKNANQLDSFASVLGLSRNQVASLIESITGTYYYSDRIANNNGIPLDPSQLQRCAAVSNAACDQIVYTVVSPTLPNVRSFLDPSQQKNNLDYIQVDLNNCDRMPVKSTNVLGEWEGLRRYLDKAFFVNPNAPVTDASGRANSGTIVYWALYDANDSNLSPEARNILTRFSNNISTMIMEAKRAHGDGFAGLVAHAYIHEYFRPEIEFYIIQEIGRMVQTARDKAPDAYLSDEMIQGINLKLSDISAELNSVYQKNRPIDAVNVISSAIRNMSALKESRQ